MTELNPFRVTTRYNGNPPMESALCALNFRSRHTCQLVRNWRNFLRFLAGIDLVTETTVECVDPELNALIEAYVHRKVEAWQAGETEATR